MGQFTLDFCRASKIAKRGKRGVFCRFIRTSSPSGMLSEKIAEAVSLDFANFGCGAVLPSPNREGKWSQRSVTSDEASRWLVELLEPHTGDLEDVSSHSLKATTLSWLAKAGSDPHHRTILGHHSSGKGSLEVLQRQAFSALTHPGRDVAADPHWSTAP